MTDVEKQAMDIPPSSHKPDKALKGNFSFLSLTLNSPSQKTHGNLEKEGLLRHSSLCHAAGLTYTISDLNVKLQQAQKVTKAHTRSARYLLHQGKYVKNWNSPDCDLSKLYGKKTPQSLSPSPLLSGSAASREQMFQFPSKSPSLPSEMPQSSRNLQSPFLSSTLELEKLRNSPILVDFLDLVQTIHLILPDLYISFCCIK